MKRRGGAQDAGYASEIRWRAPEDSILRMRSSVANQVNNPAGGHQCGGKDDARPEQGSDDRLRARVGPGGGPGAGPSACCGIDAILHVRSFLSDRDRSFRAKAPRPPPQTRIAELPF